MLARLCLALLLIGSAPLTVAQQADCGMQVEQSDAPQPMDGHAHHGVDSVAPDSNSRGGTAEEGHACGDCDLACLAACAGTAAADLARPFSGFQRHSPQQQDLSAALRQAHGLGLLRPPTSLIS